MHGRGRALEEGPAGDRGRSASTLLLRGGYLMRLLLSRVHLKSGPFWYSARHSPATFWARSAHAFDALPAGEKRQLKHKQLQAGSADAYDEFMKLYQHLYAPSLLFVFLFAHGGLCGAAARALLACVKRHRPVGVNG